MNIELLRLFVRVAELGSLTKAASVLNMVQPVISRNISNLESEIGGRLFNRTGRGVELAELGQQFLSRASALVQEFDRLAEDMRTFNQSPSGCVRLGTLTSFALHVFPPLLRQIQAELPNVTPILSIGPIGRVYQWLDEGRIDLALNLADDDLALPDRRKIGRLDAYLLGRADDPLMNRATIDFDQLHDLPLIVSSTVSSIHTRLESLAQAHRIRLNKAVKVDSFHLQFQLASQGVGYAISTPQAIVGNSDRLGLRAVRIVRPSIERTVVLGTSPRHAPSLAVQRVAAMITSITQDLIQSGEWNTLHESPLDTRDALAWTKDAAPADASLAPN